ncbi:MAG: hypothetical protein IKE43_03160 [Coriobacteriales bacterium]|nr:hypothetical protein [Coriobacteriales bacterium]
MATASAALLAAPKNLLKLCGLEATCDEIQEEGYNHLVQMIDNDSINYSPPKTFSDGEIRGILDHIRTGK